MWRNKVLWTEGLFLRPQHFQQQERYFENLIDRRSRAGRPWHWGFETLAIDAASLEIGKLAIVEAAGVLPDGTPFSFPTEDPPPEPLDLDATREDYLVHLAIALDRPGVAHASLDDGGQTPLIRHNARDAEVADVVAGGSESAPMQLGGLRLVLLRADELTGACAAMPLVRIVERRANGQVILDPQFVAPTLDSNRSPVPHGWIDELRGLLRQRCDALATRLAHPGHGGVAEVADFLLLQTVNRHLALLDHLVNVLGLHPERLYATCVGMAGDLAAFSPQRRLTESFPPYLHDDLQLAFRPVLQQLRMQLSLVHEQSAIPIELFDRKYGVRVAVVADKSLLSNANFVLAASAQMPSEALRSRLPTQVKIAPVEKIRERVNLALPGIALRALPVAPRQIPFHAGFNYFELDRGDELWKQLPHSGGIALHVSGDFPGLELQLWAVRG